ncbi:MAG: T9SS C-terminal target domain-containing protein [Bacteroidetes bacterium]|nr:MAG: T9SS C-terminal target domain-containing protein [Bacteroidota bacterium]
MPNVLNLLSLHLLLFALLHSGYAQILERKVFSTSCLTGQVNGTYFSTTFGEAIMGSLPGAGPALTQGFQQPVVVTPLAIAAPSLQAGWEAGAVQLHWYLPQAVEYGLFEIERGSAVDKMQRIARVQADGSLHYAYPDAEAASLPWRRLYYRLRLLLPDGSSAYSQYAEVWNSQTGIYVFPNPARHTLYLQGLPEKPRRLALINAMGQWSSPPIRQEQQGYAIELGHLARGTYVLRIWGEELLYSSRILIE